MALTDEESKTLVDLELAKAHRFLAQAEKRCNEEEWDSAVNRYYYACYHISQALLIHNGLSVKTHAGMIRTIGEQFIKIGKIPEEQGAFISRLMNLRQKADYNCAFDLLPKDIEMCIKQSPIYIDLLEKLIH